MKIRVLSDRQGARITPIATHFLTQIKILDKELRLSLVMWLALTHPGVLTLSAQEGVLLKNSNLFKPLFSITLQNWIFKAPKTPNFLKLSWLTFVLSVL